MEGRGQAWGAGPGLLVSGMRVCERGEGGGVGGMTGSTAQPCELKWGG